MKKLIAVFAAGLFSLSALAQTYPSPTFSGLTLQNPLTAANGGTGASSATGTGSVVLSISPTISAPTLSGTTSVSNLAVSGTTTLTGIGITATQNPSGTPAANCSQTVPAGNYCVNQFTIGGSSPYDNATISASAAFLDGFSILHNYGGGTGGRQTFVVQSTLAAPSLSGNANHNYVAGSFWAQAATGDGGTGLTSTTSKGAIFALNPLAVSYSGATNLLELTGAEFDMAAQAGSSIWYKAGLTVAEVDGDAVQGTGYDTAIGVSSEAGMSGWKNGILFGPMNGVWPISSTGCVICSTGSGAAASGIDFSSLTLTNLLKGPNGFSIDGSGNVTGATGVFGVSTNAGGTNVLEAENLSSAANTAAQMILRTGTTNASVAINQIDGTTPQAFIVSGSGDTGGIAITPAAGPITLEGNTTVAGSFTPQSGIQGITSGAAAAAGVVGQVVVATGTATSMTSGTAANLVSTSLAAGDWDCNGTVSTTPAGTTTVSVQAGGLTTTSATLPSFPNSTVLDFSAAAGQGSSFTVPTVEFNASTATTVYLVSTEIFAVSTLSATGSFRCRRMH